MIQEPGWIDTALSDGPAVDRIGTLGPAGTSSEQAALYLWADRGPAGPPTIHLYNTYETAGQALRERTVSHVVIANAYAGIHSFYMDPSLRFVGAFLFDTPHYGIAASPGHRIPRRARIATHPAPVALVDELLPADYSVAEILYATSTSAAADQARRGETDLALTTQPAAKAHALEFISRTRPIRMLWSVFALADTSA
ncbi:prephenate dehydratase domain-containing protein [Kitasatospora viridis]|uniref:Prephenate dehydratase n=1 Tax=Kitasatospora viridis TaxID=281105 RepID=A0A561TSW1_9ACTN|nr:prephenate dehydratase domain-containing protein [Kitasatospora viridis]TWF90205.1 prephenate dehydratase [Kitasatospora viridis]